MSPLSAKQAEQLQIIALFAFNVFMVFLCLEHLAALDSTDLQKQTHCWAAGRVHVDLHCSRFVEEWNLWPATASALYPSIADLQSS